VSGTLHGVVRSGGAWWKWLGFKQSSFAALHALPAGSGRGLDNCGWFAKLVYIIVPCDDRQPLVLSFIGKMMVFDLIWVMTGAGPAVDRKCRPMSTSVPSGGTFDLGYPSAIAVLWFIIILVFIAVMTRLLRSAMKPVLEWRADG
jgi:hypothetical protein